MALLPFKDSQGGTWPLELSDLEGVPLGCTCQWKGDRSTLVVPWNLPLNKNSVPPLARPLNSAALRSAQLSHRVPPAGLRRGLARITVKLRGPCAPRTRIRSISPVRLGPVINPNSDFTAFIPEPGVESRLTAAQDILFEIDGVAEFLKNADNADSDGWEQLVNKTGDEQIDFQRKNASIRPPSTAITCPVVLLSRSVRRM